MSNSIQTNNLSDDFHWRNNWYPVIFEQDLAKDKPYAFSLYDHSLVLFYDQDGTLSCLRDRCPHRGGRLSDGRLYEGKLECLYHGWQFNTAGDCVHIPQLLTDKTIPKKACAKSYKTAVYQGMVWVWAGDPKASNENDIPVIDALNDEETYHVDYMVDLPYDQTYLIENIIDVAHIHTAHHGLRGGGHRDLALPLKFTVLENSGKGIRAQYQSVGLDTRSSPIKNANVSFVAPNLIHYTTDYKNEALISGLALYSIPLAPGKCRLLYRKYSNFYSRKERLKPRFIEHWIQNTILKQDMALIVGQYSETEKSKKELRELWLPIKSCDTLVIQYRKWIDTHAHQSPDFRGFASHSNQYVVESKVNTTSFYDFHTRQCSSCNSTYQAVKQVKMAIAVALVFILPLLVVAREGVWVPIMIALYGILVLLFLALTRVQRRFE